MLISFRKMNIVQTPQRCRDKVIGKKVNKIRQCGQTKVKTVLSVRFHNVTFADYLETFIDITSVYISPRYLVADQKIIFTCASTYTSPAFNERSNGV